MFNVTIYQPDNTGCGLDVYRTSTFCTYSAAMSFVDRFAAVDLDEFEDSEEFTETGEYPICELFYEIIGV